MAGFIQPQPFAIGPGQRLKEAGLARHLRWAHDRFERNILGAAKRLDPVEKGRKLEAGPGDHHRPCLDAAHAVDAFLDRELQQVFQPELLRLADETVDLHRPGRRFEVAGIGGGIALAGPEFIEVVVARDVGLRVRSSSTTYLPFGALSAAAMPELLPARRMPPAAAPRNARRLMKIFSGVISEETIRGGR